MDLNMDNVLLCESANQKRLDMLSDTALSLDFGYGTCKETGIQSSGRNAEDLSAQDDGCRLVLGLGPTPSSCFNNYFQYRTNMAKESTTHHNLSFGSESDSGMLRLGLSGGAGDLDVDIAVANPNPNSCCPESMPYVTGKRLLGAAVDEGSTSARRNSGGYMPALLLAPRSECKNGNKDISRTKELLATEATHLVAQNNLDCRLHTSPDSSATTDSSLADTSQGENAELSVERKVNHHHLRKCRFKGCSKGARGASGLCIAHGGGQRCQKPGCNKGAESRTAYCKAHGGGRRCQELGCTKSAEGKTDFCIAHGGGRRCGHTSCTKAARGKSGLCIKHGGGKRCGVEGCTRSAEGQAGLCISHGGGRRCQFAGCGKGAQGSTIYCKRHGGGKRCIFEGCTKGAEGSTPLCKSHGGGKRCLHDGGGVCPKSVHGGTDYCVAHGGGKRCAVPGCSKSARGRTDYCVRHGGGKRCRFQGCEKSAQGSTDFCKAHGGGKRCTWGEGCEKFARGRSGLCAAHGSLMAAQQVREAGQSGSMIGPGLFRGLVSASTTTVGSSKDNEYSSSAASALSDCIDSSTRCAERLQLLIPPQVLVPPSMKSPSSSSALVRGDRDGGDKDRSFSFVVPEGRVHGGGLLSLFGGDLKNAFDTGIGL